MGLVTRGIWNLSSMTKNQTGIPCIARWILSHWTTREVLFIFNVYSKFMIVVIESLSHVQLFVIPRTATHRLPCLSPSPRWCEFMSTESVMPSNHLSSVTLTSFCLQSFPASGSFPRSWLFASGGQNIGTSASASVLQWIFRIDFLLDWLVCSPCCPRDS